MCGLVIILVKGDEIVGDFGSSAFVIVGFEGVVRAWDLCCVFGLCDENLGIFVVEINFGV